jgi:glycosyltransferase involved in cell wall biosynthesis
VASGHQDSRELAWEAPLLRADWLIAVSRHGADILAGRGVPRERIMVASGGYDRIQMREGLRPSRPSPAGARALCVAQWIPRKGIVELVRAWGKAAGPADLLELVGEIDADPQYAQAVRAAIAATGAQVIVRGAVGDTELEESYAKADLFALPTRYEGYGMALAEALAHNLPVVSCAIGPIPELLGPNAGLLVPPGDEAALARALAQLIGDPSLRAQMATAARARAAELPTWDDTSGRVANALSAAIVSRIR